MGRFSQCLACSQEITVQLEFILALVVTSRDISTGRMFPGAQMLSQVFCSCHTNYEVYWKNSERYIKLQVVFM